MGNYGFMMTEVWVEEEKIKQKMFDSSGVLLPM